MTQCGVKLYQEGPEALVLLGETISNRNPIVPDFAIIRFPDWVSSRSIPRELTKAAADQIWHRQGDRRAGHSDLSKFCRLRTGAACASVSSLRIAMAALNPSIRGALFLKTTVYD